MGHLEHPALLYDGLDDFLRLMVPFVSDGLDNDEFVFVAARSDNIAALRAAIGECAPVRWADTERWHPHPGTRLRAFYELITDQLEEDSAGGADGVEPRRLRLAGEPVWPQGPPELVREWQRYESVLNMVLAPFPATLICLYDAAGLDSSLVDAAHRTHPTIHRHGTERPSGAFERPAELMRSLNPGLAPPPPTAAHLQGLSDLATARGFVWEQALRAGLEPGRAGDLCLAANEILTNALVHGSGATSLCAWLDDGRFLCQIEDWGSSIADPLAGYLPPAREATGGRGLWLVRQLVDLLQIVPGPHGTTVRLSMARPDGSGSAG